MQHILEATMLICFGASWPMAIIKTVKAKNPAGKSIIFLCLVEIGYFAGLMAKVIYVPEDPVAWLYLLNLLMVGADLVLTIYYKMKNDRNSQVAQTQTVV